jgi:hypothetical protein
MNKEREIEKEKQLKIQKANEEISRQLEETLKMKKEEEATRLAEIRRKEKEKWSIVLKELENKHEEEKKNKNQEKLEAWVDDILTRSNESKPFIKALDETIDETKETKNSFIEALDETFDTDYNFGEYLEGDSKFTALESPVNKVMNSKFDKEIITISITKQSNICRIDLMKCLAMSPTDYFLKSVLRDQRVPLYIKRMDFYKIHSLVENEKIIQCIYSDKDTNAKHIGIYYNPSNYMNSNCEKIISSTPYELFSMVIGNGEPVDSSNLEEMSRLLIEADLELDPDKLNDCVMSNKTMNDSSLTGSSESVSIKSNKSNKSLKMKNIETRYRRSIPLCMSPLRRRRNISSFNEQDDNDSTDSNTENAYQDYLVCLPIMGMALSLFFTYIQFY